MALLPSTGVAVLSVVSEELGDVLSVMIAAYVKRYLQNADAVPPCFLFPTTAVVIYLEIWNLGKQCYLLREKKMAALRKEVNLDSTCLSKEKKKVVSDSKEIDRAA